MKVRFLCVGRLKKGFYKDGVDEYLGRIKRYSRLEHVEVKEGPASRKTPEETIREREAGRILSSLPEGHLLVALDERGKGLDSRGLARVASRVMNGPEQGVTFIVGGAWGLHKSVTDRADRVLSLSKMTLPHELARLVLAEQVYRAFTIIRGEPYSH